MFLFLKIMFTEFIAEMGDKTQLMLIAMTAKFKVKDIVIGTAVAVMVLNALAVLAGGLVGSLVPAWLIKLIAALAFMYFAVTSLASEEEEEEDAETKGNFKFAPLSVFTTFFLAELGDKTQLTAMAFGANEGLSNALIVWAACSVGLFASDILGMLIGLFLKNQLNESMLNKIAFVIFALFGVYTVYEGLSLLLVDNTALVLGISGVVAVVFAAVCLLYYKKHNSK